MFGGFTSLQVIEPLLFTSLLIRIVRKENETGSLLHRLRHPPQRQHPRLPRARGNRHRRAAGGVLRGAPPQRPPAPAGGVLPRRRGPVDPRPPRRAQRRQRSPAPLPPLEPG